MLLAMWFGPVAELARSTFFGHMAVHMGVVAVATPLLAAGIAGTRFDPVRRWPRQFSPIPVSMLEFVTVWAWHAPQLHHTARHTTWGLIAEQGTFFVTGLWLWLSAIGGERPRPHGRSMSGAIALLLTAMHMTLLGVLIGLAPRPLYPHAAGLSGLTPLQDQHLGGVVMIFLGGASYLTGGLWLMSGVLRGKVAR